MAASQRELYTQRKLKDIYHKTCIRLAPFREGIKLLQEAVLWRRPLLAVLLYGLIHFVFWNIYNLTDNSLTLLGRVIFWLLLVDGFWVIATRDKDNDSKNQSSSRSTWRTPLSRIRRSRNALKFLTFDEVVIKDSTPLETGEVLVFDVVCFRIAISLMWADNIQLALRHWNREQPYMLTGFVFTGAVVCCLVGYFISGLLLAYITVLFLLIFPIVAYYDLVSHASHMIDVNYPIITQKLQYWHDIVKKHFRKLPDEEFRDYQLERPTVVANGNHHTPSGHQPIPKDPSISLTPFSNDFNTMDSLVGSSFTPHRHGFHYSPDDSLFLSPAPSSAPPPPLHQATPIPHQSHGLSITHKAPPTNTANLSIISETSEDSANLDLDESNDPSESHDSNERRRTGTMSLGPFSSRDNPLHDSFDDLIDINENGINDSSPIPHTTNTTNTTTTTTTTTSNTTSNTSNGVSSSPYFATKMSFPSSLMSTPLEENDTQDINNGVLRNRHNKD